MPFCSHCGAQTQEGAAFCGNCGTAAATTPPVAPAVPPQAAPPFPPQAASAKKGPNLFLWIGGGLAAILLLIILVVVGAGFFVAKKAHDMGVDSELMRRNPALGAARLALAMNPEVEIVRMDEEKGELTVREKKTGKVITMRAEDVKQGRISFTDESSGEQVTIGGEGEAELPDWVPDYPGSRPQGAISSKGGSGRGGLVHFQVSDSPERVIKYYRDELSGAGYKVTTPASGGDGGMVSGEDEASHRTVAVVVGRSGGQTQVSVTYSTRQ